MPNVMAALSNIGGALCSTPQSLLTPTTRVPCSNAAKTRNPLKFTVVLNIAYWTAFWDRWGSGLERFATWYHHVAIAARRQAAAKSEDVTLSDSYTLLLTFMTPLSVLEVFKLSGILITFFYNYRMQWTAESSVLAPSVCDFLFVYIWNISGTAEQICAKFTRKTCLVRRSDEFEGQGQRSRPPGQKPAFMSLSAPCMRFVFGETSLASGILIFSHSVRW